MSFTMHCPDDTLHSSSHSQHHTNQDGESIDSARARFPRGLLQPEGSFRFSIDALLLARFASMALPAQAGIKQNATPLRIADLGTGCGVVALAILLEHPAVQATGIDIGKELTQAAIENAHKLGVTDRFTGRTLNLAELTAGHNKTDLQAESFQAIVCNPPYRKITQGRHAATTSRTRALFETEGSLLTFIRAAAFLLQNKGRFCCIYPAERLTELLSTLEAARLTPKRMLPVYSKADKEAQLILLEARKNGKPGMALVPPLVLYSGTGEKTVLSDAALHFCPALACNAGTGQVVN